MSAFAKLKNWFGSTFFWLMFTLLFGFLQVFVDFLVKYSQGEKFNNFTVLVGGAILFFASGLVASSAYEVWTSPVKGPTRPLSPAFVFLHILIPWVIVIVNVVVYVAVVDYETFEEARQNIAKYNMESSQPAILSASIIYALICRTQLSS